MNEKKNKKHLIEIGKSVIKINEFADRVLPVLITSLITIVSILVSITIFLKSTHVTSLFETSNGLYKQFFLFL